MRTETRSKLGMALTFLLLAGMVALTFGGVVAQEDGRSASFAGTWQPLGMEVQIMLAANGTSVTGYVTTQTDAPTPITGGRISGDTITFTVDSPSGDRTITFQGTLSGDSISFQRTVAVHDGGTLGGNGIFGARGGAPAAFVATRVGPGALSQAAPGAVQGVVLRGDTGSPLADVRVTLSGGPSDPRAVQALLNVFANDNVKLSPPPQPGESGELLIQRLTDAAAARGVTTGVTAYQTALQQFRTANEERFSAVSDAEGRFTIEGVPPSEYTVRGQREGFVGVITDVATSPVKVTSKETADTRLSMLPGAAISGRIVDSAGLALPNVTVTAYKLTYRDGFPTLQSVVSRTTDDRGDYRLFWFGPGSYMIAALPRAPEPAALTAAQGRRSAGTATSAVAPKPVSAMSFYPGTADAGTATRVVVTRSDVSGIDIPMQTVAPAKVSGQVRFVMPEAEAGARAQALPAQAEIILRLRDVNVPELFPQTQAQVVATATLRSGAGTFEAQAVLPGSYDLYARVPFSNPDGGSPVVFAHTPVDVQGQDVSGVSLVVYPSVRVNGTVSIDGHDPGNTVVRVALRPVGTEAKIGPYQNIARRPVVAAKDGAVMIPAVIPGLFRVDVQSLPPEFYVADVLQGGASVFDSGIEVAGGSPPPFQVVVRSGAAKVEGVVRDGAGHPVPGASIVLVPVPERRENPVLYSTATTDSAGRFTMTSIAPGLYKVFAWEEAIAPGAYFNSGFLGRYEERGQAINLTQLATANAVISAIPAGE